MIIIAEYIWIDGDYNLRSKTKIFEHPFKSNPTHESDFPKWNFDGSSTGQSQTKDSDLVLNPIYFKPNPIHYKQNSYVVLCEVEGTTEYSNLMKTHNKTRNEEPWFGIEQEYIMLDRKGKLYGIDDTEQIKSNRYYCSVGYVNPVCREIMNEHMIICIDAGIKICGINTEVTPSQFEFQIGPLGPLEVCNQLWLSRYFLIRIAEKYNVRIEFHPKPFPELNGSGAHTNYSTKKTRDDNGIIEIYKMIDKLSKKHTEHIEVYGRHNELRLIGTNETANINEFKYGECDRTSSIRIPINVSEEKKGYLEDRRPASNMNPYLVVHKILETTLV